MFKSRKVFNCACKVKFVNLHVDLLLHRKCQRNEAFLRVSLEQMCLRS